jgi:CDP-diacylglycerol---glycerol-3-phosphate 3-phosphatidyltransferase
MTSSIVSPELRAKVRSAVIPIALAMGRAGLTPNALTVIGFAISTVAAYAALNEAWLIAGLLVIGGGVFDLFDGALARAQHKANRLGAYMDSVFDRAGEAVVFVGIVGGLVDAGWDGGPLYAAAALAASSLVPYTRAKSESLGFTPGSGMASVGLAPREVRLVILTIGLVAAGLLGTDASGETPLGILALEGALLLIAILATLTAIQRTLHVVRQSAGQNDR